MEGLHPLLLRLGQQMQLPSPLQKHTIQLANARAQTFWVKHEEAIHPEVAGNKWRKLVPHLHSALAANAKGLITYGGAYSQHLPAVAWCANALGMSAMGYVRGEVPATLNPLLTRCRAMGMQLIAKPRTGFVEHGLAAEGLDGEGNYHIPLGGASPAGAAYYGQSLWAELEPTVRTEDLTQIWLSAGTGTSAAGLWLAAGGRVVIHVVPAYKTGASFWVEMSRLTQGRLKGPDDTFVLEESLPYTRFVRPDAALQTVAGVVQLQTGLNLEPVYEQRLFAEALAQPGHGRLVVHNGVW